MSFSLLSLAQHRRVFRQLCFQQVFHLRECSLVCSPAFYSRVCSNQLNSIGDLFEIPTWYCIYSLTILFIFPFCFFLVSTLVLSTNVFLYWILRWCIWVALIKFFACFKNCMCRHGRNKIKFCQKLGSESINWGLRQTVYM